MAVKDACTLALAMCCIAICVEAGMKYSNKYSKEANKVKDYKTDRDSENPFRMLKVNLLWKKASKVSDPVAHCYSCCFYMCVYYVKNIS